MIFRLREFFLFVALLLVNQAAAAEKRVALVVGNSTYQNAALLPNPANDAAAVALKNAGFVLVDSRLDLRAADTRRALRDFADQARDGDVAVVYHAGHGIEIDGSFWAGQKNPAPGNTTVRCSVDRFLTGRATLSWLALACAVLS